MLIERNINRWDAVVDVIVAGGGCAGLSTVLGAAERGLDILVIERGLTVGGSAALSGGVIYCGGGTPVQTACGFQDSVEDMRSYLLASTGPGPDIAKIDRYCEESVAHFEWLVGLGVPFKNSYWPQNYEPPTDDCLYYSGSEFSLPYRDLARPAPRGHTVQMPGSCTGGAKLMAVLEQHARRAATLITDARLHSLVQSGCGSVIGVSYRKNDEIVHVRARAGVVLATGGFIMNREMVAAFAPQAAALDGLGNPYDDGSGIQFGAAAGGATINMSAVAYACPVLAPPELMRGILVNARGQRFVDESSNHKRLGENSVLHQSGSMFLLVDSHTYVDPAKRMEIVATGETTDDLETELGWPQGALGATLDLYNHHARKGHDPLFGKSGSLAQPLDKPPYAVFNCSLGAANAPYLGFTLGGLRTDLNGCVLTPGGEAVPGLYAVGRTTSCLSAQSCGSSGLQLGEGTFFGRQTGRALQPWQ